MPNIKLCFGIQVRGRPYLQLCYGARQLLPSNCATFELCYFQTVQYMVLCSCEHSIDSIDIILAVSNDNELSLF
jgi:hypothetical protein